MANYL